MLRGYEGGLKLADNLLKMLRGISIGRVVEDDINFTIKGSITYKVVISSVEERKSNKLELRTEVGEETMSSRVVRVYIRISTEKVGCIRIFQAEFLDVGSQVSQRGHEEVLFT